MPSIRTTFELDNQVSPALDQIIGSATDVIDTFKAVDNELSVFSSNSLPNLDELSTKLDSARLSAISLSKAVSNNELVRSVDTFERIADRTKMINHQASGAVNAIDRINADLGKTAGTAENIVDPIKESSRHMDDFHDGVIDTNRHFDGLVRGARRLAVAIGGTKLVSNMVEASDNMINMQARMRGIAREGETIAQVQDTIFQSAQNAGMEFEKMADQVTKIGRSAGQYFSSTSQLTQFTETLAKAFQIEGVESQQIDSIMYNMVQALNLGVLRGQDLHTVMTNSAMITQMIADELGVGTNMVKEMAEQGAITSDVLINAVLNNAKAINAEFENIGATFEKAWTRFKNASMMAIQPILEAVNRLFASDQFEKFMDNLVALINKLVPILTVAVDTIVTGLTYVMEAFNSIIPDSAQFVENVAQGGLAVLGLYGGIKLVTTLVKTIPALLKPISLGVSALVIGVGALINKVKDQAQAWVDSTGMVWDWQTAVEASVATVQAAIENVKITFSNMVGQFKSWGTQALDDFATLVENIATLNEDVVYCFDLAIYSIKYGFLSMVNWILQKVSIIVDAFKFASAISTQIWDNLWTYIQIGARKMGQGVVAIVQGAMNGMLQLIQDAINGVISMLNQFISSNPVIESLVGAVGYVQSHGVSGLAEANASFWEGSTASSRAGFLKDALTGDEVQGPVLLNEDGTPANEPIGFEFTPIEKIDLSEQMEKVDRWAEDIIGGFQTSIDDLSSGLGELPSWESFKGSTDLSSALGVTQAMEGLEKPTRGDYNFTDVRDLADRIRGVADDIGGRGWEPEELNNLSDVWKETYTRAQMHKILQEKKEQFKDLINRFKGKALKGEDTSELLDEMLGLAGQDGSAGGGSGGGGGRGRGRGGVGRIADNTDAILQEIQLSNEQIKNLRDIAEKRAIERYTLRDIKVEQINHNHIANDMDIDGVNARLVSGLKEAQKIYTQGVGLIEL